MQQTQWQNKYTNTTEELKIAGDIYSDADWPVSID